ncbi:Hypothetical predicted protein [Marmota monax]|uniref:Uncharacterized protein n=1 Tax=Marmota monax TaxID=9995 RepID=A0A5E4BLD8_MARMO|nr:Hypothetical predicted protein [Marmota monax]
MHPASHWSESESTGDPLPRLLLVESAPHLPKFAVRRVPRSSLSESPLFLALLPMATQPTWTSQDPGWVLEPLPALRLWGCLGATRSACWLQAVCPSGALPQQQDPPAPGLQALWPDGRSTTHTELHLLLSFLRTEDLGCARLPTLRFPFLCAPHSCLQDFLLRRLKGPVWQPVACPGHTVDPLPLSIALGALSLGGAVCFSRGWFAYVGQHQSSSAWCWFFSWTEWLFSSFLGFPPSTLPGACPMLQSTLQTSGFSCFLNSVLGSQPLCPSGSAVSPAMGKTRGSAWTPSLPRAQADLLWDSKPGPGHSASYWVSFKAAEGVPSLTLDQTHSVATSTEPAGDSARCSTLGLVCETLGRAPANSMS